MTFIPYPFVRLVLFLAVGITAYLYFPNGIPERVFVPAMMVLSCLLLTIFAFNRKWNRLVVNPGLLGASCTILLGYILTFYHTGSRNPDHFMHQPIQAQYYKIEIADAVVETNTTWKTKGRITAMRCNGEWLTVSGDVLLYFSRSDFPLPPVYGDVFLINKSPAAIESPGNPGEFNYQQFLSYQQIYHQYFLRQDNLTFVHHRPAHAIIQLSLHLRDWAERILKQHISGKAEQSVAIALVLGITDELDDEMLKAYSASGAMHILAVSGLHIAILYAILLAAGKHFQHTRRGQITFSIISLLLLWLYAFITGLTPSVLRAVTMFSFIAIGKLINRQGNVYNTMAATAFCLLLYNPYLIVSVGFQLSFAAVFGIVYVHPYLHRRVELKNRVLHYLWETTSISIAAQLATFALGLLYFHQFPNYFLLTNLVVILASNGILIGGILVLATSVITPLAHWTGVLLTGLIKFMNLFVFWIEGLPYSVTTQIYITTPQFWLIAGIITFLILTIVQRRLAISILAFLCAGCFSALQWVHHQEEQNRTQFIVYHIKGHTAIDFISHGHCYTFTDHQLRYYPTKERFHVAPYRMKSQVTAINLASELPYRETRFGIIIRFGGKNFLIRQTENLQAPPPGFPADFIIFANQKEKHFQTVQSAIPTALCIFDSSNSIAYVNRIRQTSVNEDLVYSVRHRGACQQNL